MRDKTYKFRCGKVRPASSERIEKVRNVSINSLNVGLAYFNVCITPFALYTLLRFCVVVICKFFMVQYLEKLHVLRIPVKHVDHELDSKIPFRPELVDTYLDFINFWIRPMVLMIKRFGMNQGRKLQVEYLRYIRQAYSEAFRMYSHHMTTTNRPSCKDVRAVRNLQHADPHYLCVPSLHIAVVCLTYSFYKKIFERENFTDEEKDMWNREIYSHGKEIAESVLYMKQHSANCIPAAMHMMTNIAPELFTVQMAVSFIDDLFRDATDISAKDREHLIEHIQFMYERLILESTLDDDWTEPVKNWLKNYIPS